MIKMGWFNFKSNSNTSNTSNSNTSSINSTGSTGSTGATKEYDFLTNIPVGDRDLSKPFINDSYVDRNGSIRFGVDNLYPELINNLYLTSSIHSACINYKTNSIIGGGYNLKDYETSGFNDKMELKKFKIRNNFDNNFEIIVKNFIKHGRSPILIKFNDKGHPISFKVLDPSNVRSGRSGIFVDIERYFISDDWQLKRNVMEVKPYSPSCKDTYQLFELRGHTGGSKTYPLPEYVANSNWTYLDGEISYLYKQGIVNSINPSMIFKFPFETTPEQKSNIKRMLTTLGKGAKNMGRIFTFWKDQSPEIETVQTSSNDKLYREASSEIKDNICFAHQINPAIMGVARGGQLGNVQELEVSYNIFKRNWVKPNKHKIELFINDIFDIFKINYEFEILDDDINIFDISDNNDSDNKNEEG